MFYESRKCVRFLARIFLGLLGLGCCVASVNATNARILINNNSSTNTGWKIFFSDNGGTSWASLTSGNSVSGATGDPYGASGSGGFADGYLIKVRLGVYLEAGSITDTEDYPLAEVRESELVNATGESGTVCRINGSSLNTCSFELVSTEASPEYKYDFRILNGTLNWQRYEIYTNGVLIGRAEVAPGATSSAFTGECTETVYPVRIYSPSSVPPFDVTYSEPGGPWISCDGGLQQNVVHNGGGLLTQTTNMMAVNLELTNQAGSGFARTNQLTEGVFLLAVAQQMGRDVEGQAQLERAISDSGSNTVAAVDAVRSAVTNLNQSMNSNTNRQWYGALSEFSTNDWGVGSQTWSNDVAGTISGISDTNFSVPSFESMTIPIHGTNVISLDPTAHAWIQPLAQFARRLIWWVLFIGFAAFAVEKTTQAARDALKGPQGRSPVVGATVAGTGARSSLFSWVLVRVVLAGIIVAGIGGLWAYMADRISVYAVANPLGDAVGGTYGLAIKNAIIWVDTFIPVNAAVVLGIVAIGFELFVSIAAAGIMFSIRMVPSCIALCAIQLEASNWVEVWNGRATNSTVVVDSLEVELPAGYKIAWQDITSLEVDGTNVPFSDGVRNWISLGEAGYRAETDEFALQYFLLGIGASSVWIGLRWALQMMKAGGLPGQYGD